MSHLPSTLVCQGCGHSVPPDEPYPFRCPNADQDEDIDHVLRRVLDISRLESPEALSRPFLSDLRSPFLRFGRLLHSYQTAHQKGLDDTSFAKLVTRIDAAVEATEGRGFRVTPFAPADKLAQALDLRPGALWVKDETGNVSGSHKARHLMGLMLWMEMGRQIWPESLESTPRLAIASCGNAALGAAVVARAMDYPLDVYVPTWADAAVTERLAELGATLVPCSREGSMTGDPCYHRFKEAVAEGALPFTCQGTENGLVIEGGKTLVWEMVSTLMLEERQLDHLCIQVGGGALASACIQGLLEARTFGALDRLPAIHTVQTSGAHPLHRSWEALIERVLVRHQRETREMPPHLGEDAERAEFVRDRVSPELLQGELHYAATHRSEFMWPWEEEPASIATGILDDETYDWLAVVEGMLLTGGIPLVVDEQTLTQAHTLAREHTSISADPSGTSGLAGLLELQSRGEVQPEETIAVLLTGVER
jgi:threonine synthase